MRHLLAMASLCENVASGADPGGSTGRRVCELMRAISYTAGLVIALAVSGCGGGDGERGPGPAPSPGPAPALASTIDTGGSPAAVAAGEGSVWVADNLRGRLLRIDPEVRTQVRSTRAGDGPVAVAVTSGAVWVASADGTVRRFDARTGAATDDPESVPGAAGIAVGEGSVWVTSQSEGTVTRLDPATGRRRGQTIEVGPQPTDIAVGGGGVWVANSEQMNGTVSRIDPDSGEPGDPIKVAKGQVFALTYGEGGVWVAASDEIRGDEIKVTRIDPESSKPEGDFVRLDQPGLPVRLAAGAGAVWLAQAGGADISSGTDSGTLARLDPEARRQIGKATDLPGPPTGVSVGEGGVWVAIGGDGALAEVTP
jgi:DNA-binding beta-propeller fold protein YncE